jgi:hypothetical protein
MAEYAGSVFRRLCVAMDAAGCEAVDWEATMDLAAVFGAELRGLFVEDEDLLGLAALPIAQELGGLSGRPRILQRARMESLLRRRISRSAEALARAGQSRKVTVSHETARGKLVQQALARGDRGDILLLHAGQAQRPRDRGPGSILLWPGPEPMHVRCAQLALSLARRSNTNVVLGVPAELPADRAALLATLGGTREHSPTAITVREIHDARPETILGMARSTRSVAIVLGLDDTLAVPNVLEYLLQNFRGSLFLVR